MPIFTHIQHSLEQILQVADHSVQAGQLLAVGKPDVKSQPALAHFSHLDVQMLEGLHKSPSLTLHCHYTTLDSQSNYNVCVCVGGGG